MQKRFKICVPIDRRCQNNSSSPEFIKQKQYALLNACINAVREFPQEMLLTKLYSRKVFTEQASVRFALNNFPFSDQIETLARQIKGANTATVSISQLSLINYFSIKEIGFKRDRKKWNRQIANFYLLLFLAANHFFEQSDSLVNGPGVVDERLIYIKVAASSR